MGKQWEKMKEDFGSHEGWVTLTPIKTSSVLDEIVTCTDYLRSYVLYLYRGGYKIEFETY